jgi:hypothetical protein
MPKPTLSLVSLLGLATVTAFASDDSFVGKWKFNSDKSQLNGLEYKIEDAGDGKYKFIFGDDVETMTLDGKEHTSKYGNVWSIKTTGPISWDVTIKRDGKVTSRFKWSLSEDGQTFLSIEETERPDGSTGRVESSLKRTGGTMGIAGSWESNSVKVLSPTSIEIAKGKTGGYSLIIPTYKERVDFKFDGKNYMPTGPRVPKEALVTAKKIGDRALELTYKLKGKTTDTHKWEVSEDGKTLTETVTYSGVSKPEVDVYDRQ